LLREGQVSFDGLDLAAHVRDNRVSRFVIGDRLAEEIRRSTGERQEGLDVLMASLHCTDNVIDGAISQLVARHLSLSGNEFSLAAVRGNRETIQDQRVADVIGSSAVYTANHAQRTGFGVIFNAQISNITQASAEAANLEITLVP
jgi:hypothetical protein